MQKHECTIQSYFEILSINDDCNWVLIHNGVNISINYCPFCGMGLI